MKFILVALFAALACAQAGTVTWTGTGGNGLWNYGPNWDTKVIPTNTDDVVINLGTGANVTVSDESSAFSVTLSGTNNILIVQAGLTIGKGALQVDAGCAVILQGNPATPLQLGGTSSVAGQFWFYSGLISGSPLTVTGAVRLIGPSSMEIDSLLSVKSDGRLQVSGNPTVQLKNSGLIAVAADASNTTVEGSATFVSDDKTGQIDLATGIFVSGDATLSFQLVASISEIECDAAAKNYVVIASYVNVGAIKYASIIQVIAGATLELKGATSAGYVVVQGTLNITSTGSLSSVNITLDQGLLIVGDVPKVSADRLITTGGTLSGQAHIKSLLVASDKQTALTIAPGSDFTFNDGNINTPTNLIVKDSALGFGTLTVRDDTNVQQAGGGGDVHVDGVLTVMNATLNVAVDLQVGNGTMVSIVLQSANLQLQAITFSGGAVECTDCGLYAIASKVVLESFTGISGRSDLSIQAEPSATITGKVQTNNFNVSGSVVVDNLVVSTKLTLINGALTISANDNSTAAAQFEFQSGTLTARNAASLTCDQLLLTTNGPKTLSVISVVASFISEDCGNLLSCTVIFNGGASIRNRKAM